VKSCSSDTRVARIRIMVFVHMIHEGVQAEAILVRRKYWRRATRKIKKAMGTASQLK
jgi:hypothetical protein